MSPYESSIRGDEENESERVTNIQKRKEKMNAAAHVIKSRGRGGHSP